MTSSGDQRAETQHALQEVAGKTQAQLARDFGRFAPSPELAAQLVEQLESAEATRQRAETLVAYCVDKEDLAAHDAVTFLVHVKKNVRHAADMDPAVARRYPKLLALVEQRRDAIVEGIARSRAERAAEKLAGKASDKIGEPATDKAEMAGRRTEDTGK